MTASVGYSLSLLIGQKLRVPFPVCRYGVPLVLVEFQTFLGFVYGWLSGIHFDVIVSVQNAQQFKLGNSSVDENDI